MAKKSSGKSTVTRGTIDRWTSNGAGIKVTSRPSSTTKKGK